MWSETWNKDIVDQQKVEYGSRIKPTLTAWMKETKFWSTSSTPWLSKDRPANSRVFLFRDPGVFTVKSMADLLGGREDDLFSFFIVSWSLDIVVSRLASVKQALERVILDLTHNIKILGSFIISKNNQGSLPIDTRSVAEELSCNVDCSNRKISRLQIGPKISQSPAPNPKQQEQALQI